MNINRGVVLLICDIHTHLEWCTCGGEELLEKEENQVFDFLVGFTFFPFGASILRKLLLGFFPLGFSQDKYLYSFCVVVLVYLSVIFWLMVMLL